MSQKMKLPAIPKLARTSAGLEPYVPSLEQPWDERRASHLLRRTLIGPTPTEIGEALQSTPSEVINRLLLEQPAPEIGLEWINDEPFGRPISSEDRAIERGQVHELRSWWMEQIVNQSYSIRERMTLFWHDHFATQAKDVKRPHLMYLQNETLRKHAMGNFKTLVQAITRDPAMLYYLDGRVSRVGKPNENFARELMELFTTGVDQYTEEDIGEAARAFTGWIVEGRTPTFVVNRFDKKDKTFMGRTGNFNDIDIINIVFEQEVTAVYIARKIYKEFVYQIPDESMVSQLAQVFRENHYEIAPMMRALLSSAHFFDDSFIGAQIKNPIEHTAGTARSLGLEAGEGKDIVGRYLVELSKTLGQWLFDPPNVAGWPGYRIWISTSTLPERHKMTDEIVDNNPRRAARIDFVHKQPDMLRFIKSFPEPFDAIKLVRGLGECLTPFGVNEDREQLFLSTLL